MSKILIKTQKNMEKQKLLEVQEKTFGINIKSNRQLLSNGAKNFISSNACI